MPRAHPEAAGAPATPAAPHGQLVHRVVHFARLLRGAGMAVGSDRVLLALRALPHAGLARRDDFHAVLAACLLDRHEHAELFDQAFALFWDVATGGLPDPHALGERPPETRERENRRLADALAAQRHESPPPPERREEAAEVGVSARERLRRADFDSMSAAEFAAARRLLARLVPAFAPVPTRRWGTAARGGRIDWRATLRQMGRHGGDWATPRRRAPRRAVPPLVVLADISGSMSRYSRMLLHFAHLLGRAPPRVESFVFGTRLTRITRWLRQRDPDVAIARVCAGVPDWGGGTRIAECLREFNRRWARRVGGGEATVLLVSDGLEHGDGGTLGFEMERLHKSCRRLLWLNPLLRFARFEPRAAGIRAMRPHVDEFLPVHNLQSLEQLVAVLARPARERPM